MSNGYDIGNDYAAYAIAHAKKRPRLIGLGGKLRAGKDAVADYLEEHHDFVKMGMSDALNDALLKLNPYIPTERIYADGEWVIPAGIHRYQDLHDEVGYVEAKKNPEVRRLLQMLGTEVGRDMISENVWTDIAEKRVREHWANGKSVVITALRFPNELDMLERLGGITAWVERPDAQRLSNSSESQDAGVTPESTTEAGRSSHRAIHAHASENSVSANDFQEVIVNDADLDALYEKVEKQLLDRPMHLQSVALPYDR